MARYNVCMIIRYLKKKIRALLSSYSSVDIFVYCVISEFALSVNIFPRYYRTVTSWQFHLAKVCHLGDIFMYI